MTGLNVKGKTMKITLDSVYPDDFVVCKVRDGMYWDIEDEDDTILIYTDLDLACVAIDFGWIGDEYDVCGARKYLDEIAGTGLIIDDPGYFLEGDEE